MNNNDVNLILNAKVSLVVLETHDENRAIKLLEGIFRQAGTPGWKWTVTEGLEPLGVGVNLREDEQQKEPEKLLRHIKNTRQPSAFVLCDFHPYLDEPANVRHLKDIALNANVLAHKVVLVSCELNVPKELNRYAASVSISLPDEVEILSLIREEARIWANRNNVERIKTDNQTLQKMVNNLKGLAHSDVRRLAYTAIADDGAITESDLPNVSKAKFKLMDMEGVLHYEYSTASLADVGGLNILKDWLETRKKVVLSEKFSKDAPKGVLLFGVQGGGKSLAAKTIAGIWGLPLLRLDMAALFNKFVGETEKNLRSALELADMMSPCVLWIDEIEKGMSSDSADNGVGTRLLGTLLTWMAERTSRVFMVATSNDISVLPPELMRKGRFDEIFFVDLPDQNTRSLIFNIHLSRRDLSPADFDLRELSEMAEGYTGAEIEQAVVSATYSARAQKEPVNQEKLLHAIQSTRPMSVVMAEQIAGLRAWAKGRAVLAN